MGAYEIPVREEREVHGVCGVIERLNVFEHHLEGIAGLTLFYPPTVVFWHFRCGVYARAADTNAGFQRYTFLGLLIFWMVQISSWL